MSETVVEITDVEHFKANVDDLEGEWDSIVMNALHIALMHSPRSKIERRVPKSNQNRYRKKDGSHSSVSPNMGHGNLRKTFRITPRPDGKEITIGFPASAKVQYANAMHELPDPLPSGRPVNWSSPQTGNKFVQIPLEETADSTPEEMCRIVDARLRERGL